MVKNESDNRPGKRNYPGKYFDAETGSHVCFLLPGHLLYLQVESAGIQETNQRML